MKLSFAFFGRLEECSDKDGVPYTEADWRSAYAGLPGLIAVYESERKAPGKRFAYFFPDQSDWDVQDWLRTSAGELQVEDKTYTITTINSRYVFVMDEGALSEGNRLLLCLNTGIVPTVRSVNNDKRPTKQE